MNSPRGASLAFGLVPSILVYDKCSEHRAIICKIVSQVGARPVKVINVQQPKCSAECCIAVVGMGTEIDGAELQVVRELKATGFRVIALVRIHQQFQERPHHLARDYARIAPFYDCTVGISFFLRVRDAFEKLVRRYGISFCSAADIGCGTGLFACYLNKCWGVPVYGVDRSLEMLRQATRNCPCAGVCFLRQDIRCLALPSRVDLITANFDTLNHLKLPQDLRRAFERVAANLRPNGHFYFDILTPCQPLNGYRVYVGDRCRAGSWLQQQVRWDPRRRLLRMRAMQRRVGSCGPVVERITERAYSAAELGKWLAKVGFTIRGVLDEATLRSAVDCPPRIIVVAQKVPGRAKSN